MDFQFFRDTLRIFASFSYWKKHTKSSNGAKYSNCSSQRTCKVSQVCRGKLSHARIKHKERRLYDTSCWMYKHIDNTQRICYHKRNSLHCIAFDLHRTLNQQYKLSRRRIKLTREAGPCCAAADWFCHICGTVVHPTGVFFIPMWKDCAVP